MVMLNKWKDEKLIRLRGIAGIYPAACVDEDDIEVYLPEDDEARAEVRAKLHALRQQAEKEDGAKNWSEIAVHVEGRVGKQCRERWQNHLDPSVSKAPWGPVEERELMRLHSVIGNKWVEIATHMPGRTDSSCKNQFHKITYQRPSGTRKPAGGGAAAAKRGRGGKAGGGGGKRRKGETGRAVAAGKGGKGRAKAKAGAKGTGEVLEAAPGADLLLQFMGGLG